MMHLKTSACGEPMALARLWRRLDGVRSPLILAGGVVLFWEAFIRLFKVPTFVLPAPTVIVAALVGHRAS